MNIPEFIVSKVQMYTLMLDKRLEFGPMRDRFPVLSGAIKEFLSGIETGFISNNSEDFKEFLETRVGVVEFTKPFAIRIRPGSIRLFVNGIEVFETKEEEELGKQTYEKAKELGSLSVLRRTDL